MEVKRVVYFTFLSVLFILQLNVCLINPVGTGSKGMKYTQI